MTNRKAQSEINNVKNEILSNIKKLGFTIEKSDLGKSIYLLNGNIMIDLIYASLNSRNEYFFGIEEEQFINAYNTNRNYFQIFVCDNVDQIFVIPLAFMIEILKDAKSNDHVAFHQWKPIIRQRNGAFYYTIKWYL